MRGGASVFPSFNLFSLSHDGERAGSVFDMHLDKHQGSEEIKVNIPLKNVTKGNPKKERKKEKGDGEYVEMEPDKMQ